VAKQDHFDDPRAPAANSLIVAVAVVVRDDRGRVLMIRRADNGLWALASGAQDIGEATREETGVSIEITGVVGIYSDPRHVIAYGDGEIRQEFSIVLRGHGVDDGAVRTSEDPPRPRGSTPSTCRASRSTARCASASNTVSRTVRSPS
jgi:8-oxo-dGTP pyrophosphatase MutT (NUDIX family)